MNVLKNKIEVLGGLAKKFSSRLKKMEINTIEDLLFYYPFRYNDFSNIRAIKDVRWGEIVVVEGKIEVIENKRSPLQRKILTQAIVSDKTGSLKVVWFNQPYLTRNLRPGEKILLLGKVSWSEGVGQIVSPEYEKAKDFSSSAVKLSPVYHLTAGLTNKQLRFFVRQALYYIRYLVDPFPDFLKEQYSLLDLQEAISNIHFPKSWSNLKRAQKRLKFEEIFFYQLKSLYIRKKIKESLAPPLVIYEKEIKQFVKNLPFSLTDDQKKAAWRILLDTSRDSPMNRLLEGDVGSGKTVVAALAMFNAVLNKKQAAYMVPTEVLASQHFRSLSQLYQESGFSLKLGLLIRTEQKICSIYQGKTKIEKVKKKELVKLVKEGKIDIIIGTHALIQEKIFFASLALAIIDEQHRFGVEQRKALREKSGDPQIAPHFLSMTATPIPRTLHLALAGDLDLSIIKEMPQGRKRIITKIVSEGERGEVYRFAQKEIDKGHRVFVVCPLINKSDKLGVHSVEQEYNRLKGIFPPSKIAMLHGRLKGEEKEKIMKSFKAGKISILVATSVIEVGVDVPEATVMVIEGAERFGLAQLHQFRGRVGRSDRQSYCFLVYGGEGEKTKERLEALAQYNDGFALAKKDLEIRGPGEVFSKTQSGFPQFKIASIFDYEITQEANQAASFLLEKDPHLDKFPALKRELLRQIDFHLE